MCCARCFLVWISGLAFVGGARVFCSLIAAPHWIPGKWRGSGILVENTCAGLQGTQRKGGGLGGKAERGIGKELADQAPHREAGSPGHGEGVGTGAPEAGYNRMKSKPRETMMKAVC